VSDQPSQPMTSEDMGAALAGFALSFAAVIMSPRHSTPNEVLEALADELKSLAGSMNAPDGTPTPAREAIEFASLMLKASEPPKPRKRTAKAKRG